MPKPNPVFIARSKLLANLRNPTTTQTFNQLGFWYSDFGPVCFLGCVLRTWRQMNPQLKEDQLSAVNAHDVLIQEALPTFGLHGRVTGGNMWEKYNDVDQLSFEKFAKMVENEPLPAEESCNP